MAFPALFPAHICNSAQVKQTLIPRGWAARRALIAEACISSAFQMIVYKIVKEIDTLKCLGNAIS